MVPCAAWIQMKPLDFPLPVCGEHHGRREGCAPEAKSGEGWGEKKLVVDCSADIPMLRPWALLSPRKPWVTLQCLQPVQPQEGPSCNYNRFHWLKKKQSETQTAWVVSDFWRFLLQPVTWSRDSIKVLCSSNPSLLCFGSMRRPKYRQKGIISPSALRHWVIYCSWLTSPGAILG